MSKISIIVPVYRVENYIHRCVDSILNQTFSDFELILVDDGSPDNCGLICDSYAAKDNRIQVIHKTNGGLASARNAGMDIATGEYILFCDSDDYVSPDWCEKLLCHTSTTEKRYIFGSIRTVRVTEASQTVALPTDLQRSAWNISDYIYLQDKGVVGFACNVLYNAAVLREHHLRFSETMIVEDLPFNLDYLPYMDQLVWAEGADYFYFQDCRETLSRKYYPKLYQKWQEKYRATQHFIDAVLPSESREENRRIAANKYLYLFLHTLDNTFDKRNSMGFFNKLAYNSRVVRDADFQHCLQYADASKENPKIICLLKHKLYVVAFLFQKLAQFKRYLLERRTTR